jgi:EpsI family protein
MKLRVWAPAVILACGALLSSGIRSERTLPLRQPLNAVIPADLEGYFGRDIEVSADQLTIAGVDSYLMRYYAPKDASGDAFAYSVYIGYSERQNQNRTIHSPRNCLPGAGWIVLDSRLAVVNATDGPAEVNRYLLQNGATRAIVLYWYQGRGRVEGNEYKVKINLMRDAALLGRSDESLVRVMVPFKGSELQAFELAARVAESLMPSLEKALPL